MVAFNKNSGKVPFEFGQETLATRVVERTRDYFARHPDISREEFLLSAVRREVTFREQQEMRHRSAFPRPAVSRVESQFTNRQRPTMEDLQQHAAVAERLAQLDYERRGFWPRLRRLLMGNRSSRVT